MTRVPLLSAALAALALALSPASASAEARADAAHAEAPAPRHAAWSGLLQRYVAESADGVNRFDYGALKASAADRATLDAYIAGYADLDFEGLGRGEAFAAWANLYNALTIQHIIGRYPVRSIRSGYIVGPWKKVKTVAGGRTVSLDDIEHKILRQQFDDPRVHYAVNCASYGCPNLMTRAWEAATLDADLDAAARAYVNHPRGVSVRERGGLRVSTIYKWFREDFGGSEAGVIDHLRQFAEPELLAAINANPDIKDHDYDWALNDIQR